MSELKLYTDGSINLKTKRAGWGFCAVKDNKVIYKAFGKTNYEAWSRNIDGEIQAAIEAIKWAFQNDYIGATIISDYLGVKMWAEGQWKIKSKISKRYCFEVGEHFKRFRFEHIKGHSGNIFNDLADSLAAKGKE